MTPHISYPNLVVIWYFMAKTKLSPPLRSTSLSFCYAHLIGSKSHWFQCSFPLSQQAYDHTVNDMEESLCLHTSFGIFISLKLEVVKYKGFNPTSRVLLIEGDFPAFFLSQQPLPFSEKPFPKARKPCGTWGRCLTLSRVLETASELDPSHGYCAWLDLLSRKDALCWKLQILGNLQL